MNRLIQLLNLIEDAPDKRHQQSMLYIVLTISLLSVTAVMVSANIAYGNRIQSVLQITGLLLIIFLFLTRQRRLKIPSIGLPLLAYMSVTFLAMTSNHPIRDVAMHGYFMAISIATLLLGINGIIAFTALSLLTVYAIYFAQTYGLIGTSTLSVMSITDLVILSVLWLAASCLLALIIINLNSLIERARQQENRLLQTNQELKRIRLSLEKTVQERTQRAEESRAQAEAAQKQMAQQVWLTTGKAKLEDVMRGEQTTQLLAHHVSRQICDYLRIPMGALYVVEDGVLVFAGGYAFLPDDTHKTCKIGEGIVGEVAQQKRPLHLEIDNLSLQVNMGTNQIPLKHTFVYPFLYNETVMGVLQLGHWLPFTKEQEAFLQMTADSLGVAFHTAYSRTQMSILLRSLS